MLLKIYGYEYEYVKFSWISKVPDEELFKANPTWPKDEKGMPIREAIEYLLEYGKDNYWTGEKMVEQVARVAIPIFNYVFPDC